MTPFSVPRAGGNLIQTRTTRLNDFLFQQSRAGRALPRLKLPSAGSGRVTPAGREMLAHFHWQPLPQTRGSLAQLPIRTQNAKEF